MVQITLLELNLDGAEFNAPDVLGGGDVTTTEPESDAAEPVAAPSDGGGRGTAIVGLLLGLGGLVAIGAVVRKLRGRGGDGDEPEAPTEPESVPVQ